ncbi:MAG: dihydrofolate reductase family protein [Kineosporiaceae bacterium]
MNRQVIANIMLSLDGRTTGPGGPFDMGWIVPHAITDQARDSLLAMTSGTTALLGRVNYQGFGGYWPPVADDGGADPRDRRFASWLNEVEKVVFSTTRAGPRLAELTAGHSLPGRDRPDAPRAG